MYSDTNWEIRNFVNENNYVKNMNEYVKKNKIKNYGLESETEELIKGLSRLKKNNVLILGKAGIGKTALVEKLCEMINSKQVPYILQNKTVLEISLGGILAGTHYRGSFEEKVQNLINFVTERNNIILFMDEIHTLMSCNNQDGLIGFGDMLKPYLAREDFSLIGATTIKEYEEHIAKDSAIDRRFFKLSMEEPSFDKIVNILQKSKSQYEKHYNIKLNKNDIIKVIELAKERKGAFPDKAFDELEDYCYLKSLEVTNE